MALVISTLRSCGSLPERRSASASELRDSVGVNLHLEYDDTPYADPQRTLRALRLLGLTHVRDAAMRSGRAREPRFAALATRGVRFDLFLNRKLEPQLERVAALASSAPGSVDLIEGPNEANHEAFENSRGGDPPAVQTYQRALYAGVKAEGRLQGIPVANFTYWPPLAGLADWANFHAYPDAKRPSAPQLAWMRTMAAAMLPPNVPIVCTETGYTTAGPHAVSEEKQAALIPILLLENFKARAARTYLYELFDERRDRDLKAPDPENHFGLFRVDGAPKPVVFAISRLMAALADGGAPAARTVIQHLALSGPALRTLSVTRSDGAVITFSWFSDAQAVTSRSLRADTDGGPDIQALDLSTGKTNVLRPGSTTLAAGPGPMAFIQTPLAAQP